MTTQKSTNINFEAAATSEILRYLAKRIYIKYVVPNAVIIWSTIAVAEATYLLIR